MPSLLDFWFFCKSWGVYWLPLTRELSSEARLRERKVKVYIYLYSFSPSVTAKPCHLPRQREAISVETLTLGIEPDFLRTKPNLFTACYAKLKKGRLGTPLATA